MSTKTETPKNRKERLREKKEAESQQDRTELALDVLSRRELNSLQLAEFRDKINEPEFSGLDFREMAENQKKKLHALAGTSVFELIPLLLYKKVDQSKIEDGTFFQAPPADIDTLLTVSNTQGQQDVRAAFQMLTQAFDLSQRDPFDAVAAGSVWRNHWNQICQKAFEVYPQLEKVLAGTQSPATMLVSNAPSSRDQKKIDEPGLLENTWNYVKENPGKSLGYTALGAGLAIGGYYAVTGIWDWIAGNGENKKSDEKTENKESSKSDSSGSGFFDQLWKGLTVGGLTFGAGLGLGRLSETTAVRSWLKALGWDDAKIVEALRLFSHFEFAKAWDKLMEMANLKEDPNMQVYRQITEKIKESTKSEIDPMTLAAIANENFNDYFPSDVLASIQSSITSGATDLFKDVVRQIPLLGYLAGNDEKTKQDMETIARFLSSPECQKELQENPPTPRESVLSVLARLAKVAVKTDPASATAEDLGNVAPVGAAALTAEKKAKQEQDERDIRHREVVDAIQPGEEMDQESRTLLLKDTADCLKTVEQLEGAAHTWCRDMAEEYRKFMGEKREQGEDTVDLVQALEELESVDRDILLKIRTQTRDLQKRTNEFAAGHRLTKDDVAALKKEIEEFYTNYDTIKKSLSNAEISGLNQTKLDSKKTWWQQWEGWNRAKAGAALVVYGIWGVPVSMFKGEDNNIVIDVFGTSVAAATTFELASVFWGKEAATTGKLGKFGKSLAALPRGVAKGVAAPIRVSSTVIEHYLFLEQKSLMKSVESGKLTVPEAIAKMEQYFESRGYELKSSKDATGRITVSINENGIEKSIGQKAKSFFWKSKQLNQPQSKLMAKLLGELYELKNTGVNTLRDGVLQGKMTPRLGIFEANDMIEFKNGSKFVVTDVVDGQVKGTLTLADGTTQNGILSTRKYAGIVTAENKFSFTPEGTAGKPLTLNFDGLTQGTPSTTAVPSQTPAAATNVVATGTLLTTQMETIRRTAMSGEDLSLSSNRALLDPYRSMIGQTPDIDTVTHKILDQWNRADGKNYFEDPNQVAKAKRYAAELIAQAQGIPVSQVPGANTAPVTPANNPTATPGNAPSNTPDASLNNPTATLTAPGGQPVNVPGKTKELYEALKARAPESAGAILVIALGVMSAKGIVDIQSMKGKIAAEKERLTKLHPDKAQEISEALDHQMNLLTIKQAILGGETATSAVTVFGELAAVINASPQTKAALGKMATYLPYLEKCGQAAPKVFAALAFLDLAYYWGFELPQAYAKIDKLGEEIRVLHENKMVSEAELGSTMELLQRQKDLTTDKAVVESLNKTLTIISLFAGPLGLAAAAAVAPIMYMYGGAMASAEDGAKTILDRARQPREQLFFDWITTSYDRSAAETYRIFDIMYGNLEREKAQTRLTIIASLLLQEGAGPEEMTVRKKYIRSHLGPDFGCDNVNRAKQIIEDSALFYQAFKNIDQIPFGQIAGKGFTPPIEGFPEYVVSEPYKKLVTSPANTGGAATGEVLDIRIATGLVVAYRVWQHQLAAAPVESADKTPPQPPLVIGLNAMATFLGYKGNVMDESQLKAFFTVESADYHGVYWDGKQWYLNIDYGSDIALGNDAQTLSRMIDQMKKNKASVLHDRLKSVTDTNLVQTGGRVGLAATTFGLSEIYNYVTGGASERQNEDTISRTVEGLIKALEKGVG